MTFNRGDFIDKLSEDLDLKNVWVFEKGSYSLNIGDLTELVNAAAVEPAPVGAMVVKLHTKASISYAQLSRELESIKTARERRHAEIVLDTKKNEGANKKIYGRVTAEVISSIVKLDDSYQALEEMEATYKSAKDVVGVVKELLFMLGEMIRHMMKHFGMMPNTSEPMSVEEARAIVAAFEKQLKKVDTVGLLEV